MAMSVSLVGAGLKCVGVSSGLIAQFNFREKLGGFRGRGHECEELEYGEHPRREDER